MICKWHTERALGGECRLLKMKHFLLFCKKKCVEKRREEDVGCNIRAFPYVRLEKQKVYL